VPLFTNVTSVFDIEQSLTQRVRLELVGRGRYRVVPEETGADAVLKGEISALSVRPTAFTAEQQASRYEVTVVIKVEFRDVKTGKMLFENPAQTFREEYEVTTGQVASDPSFLGQNQNALDRLANDFAKTVVSSILEAF
jgi:predicted transcriptional regulator of viral defense system